MFGSSPTSSLHYFYRISPAAAPILNLHPPPLHLSQTSSLQNTKTQLQPTMDEHITAMQEHLFACNVFLRDTHFSTNQLHSSVYTVISAATTILLLLMEKKSNTKRKRDPERSLKRNAYLARLYLGSDSDCINMVRMNRQTFFKLCTLLRSRGLLVGTINVLIEEQVAMFLHTLGHSVRNRVVRFNFQRSGETVSRYFNRVLHAIGELRIEFIKTPPLETPSKIQSNPRFMPFLKDCIGAIDGTHIKARVPKEHVIAFRGRKPYPTQNVLAAVDFDLSILLGNHFIFSEM